MNIKKRIPRIIFLLFGVSVLTLSGLNWHIGIAAWIAPILLLFYTRKAKWYEFILFWGLITVSGGVSQTCNNLLNLPEINIFNGIVFGILTAIPYLVDRLLYKSDKKFYYTLIFPAMIAIIEYIASFAIGTWGSIAHTQYNFTSLMQFGAISGIYGIWFLISWTASTLNWVIENKSNTRLVYKNIIIFGSVFIIILLYGFIRLKSEPSNNNQVKVASVVSDNEIEDRMIDFTELATNKEKAIPSHIFSDSTDIKTLLGRSSEAISNGAKIIVWNEIALIVNKNQKKYLISEIQNLCNKNQTFALISFLEEGKELELKPFNNVSILISPTGVVEWEYKKSFLQPTAEAPIINPGNYDLPVTQTKYGKLGSVICSDLDMQHYIKQAGKKSVDILLVPAYDWEEITPLHSNMASIQAIQFGCNIIRANGKGMSSIYNFKGIEVASLNNFISDERILYSKLPIQSSKTFYSQSGDILIMLCLLFIVFIVFKAILIDKRIVD